MPSQTEITRAAILVGVSLLCIHGIRARAADAHAHAKETSEVNLLPPPKEVVKLSMGYRAALADYLWATVLVGQGLRDGDRRRYDTVADLIDTINELDPDLREPYLLSDALITMQTVEAKREDAYRVRAIVERGARNRPLDPEIWRTAGQFVAFSAVAFIKDPEEQAAWKLDGAKMLARAAEIGGDTGYAGWSAISSANILSKRGERDAAIRLIQRTLSVSEDADLRDRLQRQLGMLIGQEKLEAYKRRQAELLDLSKNDLPFVSKMTLHVLGPPFETAYCAGGKPENDKRCATTWKTWAAADEVWK